MTTSSPSSTSNGWLDSILNAGLGIAKLATGTNDTPNATTPKTTTTTKATPAWIWPVVIGGGLLVVVLVFFGLRK